MKNFLSGLWIKKGKVAEPEELPLEVQEIVDSSKVNVGEFKQKIKYLEGVIDQYEMSYKDDQVIIQVMDKEIGRLEKELKESQEHNARMFQDTQRLMRFHNYFFELRGKNFEVANFDKSKRLVPFDQYFEAAERSMNEEE